MKCTPMLAAALLAAAPLAAQVHGKPDSVRHPMMGRGPKSGMMMGDSMMGQMAPIMMKMMSYAPQRLLTHKDALGLNADQVNRLSALRDESTKLRNTALAQAQAHLKELEQAATAAQPDTTVLKTHFQAVHDAMGQAHWAMLAASAQARAVLSDAQRAKADSMQATMRQRRHMMKPSH